MNEKINLIVEKDKDNDKRILSPEKTIEIVEDLDEALKTDDMDSVREILFNPQTRESLIDNRGRKNKHQLLLLESFDALIKKSSKEDNLLSINGRRLVEIMQAENIPESILLDVASVAYHSRNEKFFYKLINEVILDNRDMFRDETIMDYAKHHLATWKGVVELGKAESAVINDQVGKETGDPTLKTKTQYGRVLSSENIKLSEKGKIFQNEIIPDFDEQGNNIDKIRAMQELAAINLAKARNLNKNLNKTNLKEKEIRDRLIEESLEIAQETLESAKEVGYSNAEIVSYRILADIYEFRYSFTGDKKDDDLSKKYRKNANNRKDIYQYKS